MRGVLRALAPICIAAMLCLPWALAPVAAQDRDQVEEPAHEVIARGEGIELRDYAAMIVAEVTATGPRRLALSRGFERLAAYIFAQDRGAADDAADDKAKIAMTAPVLQDGVGQDGAGQDEAGQDGAGNDRAGNDRESGGESEGQGQGEGQNESQSQGQGQSQDAWRTRFVMPAQYTLDTLPRPPADITLTRIPARRMAVIMFNGYGEDQDLAMMEARLRAWMEEQGYTAAGKPEYGFYDGPWVPPRIRRNEVMIPVLSAAADN